MFYSSACIFFPKIRFKNFSSSSFFFFSHFILETTIIIFFDNIGNQEDDCQWQESKGKSAVIAKSCSYRILAMPSARNIVVNPNAVKPAKRQARGVGWQNPRTKDYFCGPKNVKRVQLWREDNPGYWRGKRKTTKDALQDPLNRTTY